MNLRAISCVYCDPKSKISTLCCIEKYKLVVKPHKIGSLYVFKGWERKNGNFISATLFIMLQM
jgi:hypothetical protein